MHLPAVYHRLLSSVSRTSETQIYDSNTYVKEYTYLGIVEAVAMQMACAASSRGTSSLWARPSRS